MKGHLSYLLRLVLFSLIPASLLIALGIVLKPELKPAYYEIIGLSVFFLLVTFFIHRFLVQANAKNPAQFVRAFTGVIALKMFIFLFLLLGYGLANRSHFGGFAVAFLVMYASFMAFESWALIRDLRK